MVDDTTGSTSTGGAWEDPRKDEKSKEEAEKTKKKGMFSKLFEKKDSSNWFGTKPLSKEDKLKKLSASSDSETIQGWVGDKLSKSAKEPKPIDVSQIKVSENQEVLDASGKPMMETILDPSGKPMLDKSGNPLQKKVYTKLSSKEIEEKKYKIAQEMEKTSWNMHKGRQERLKEYYTENYNKMTPTEKALLNAKLAKEKEKTKKDIIKFKQEERIREAEKSPINKTVRLLQNVVKAKGGIGQMFGTGKKEGLVLSAQNLGVGYNNNPMNNPTMHYQPVPQYNRPIPVAQMAPMSQMSQGSSPQMAQMSQKPMMPGHISSISQSPEITPMTAQPVTSSDQIGFMIARPDAGPGLREPVGMQAPSYTQPDIPQHKLQAPSYVAPSPFAAPPEFPPFGDNPMRNYTVSNVDHPLFEKNVPRQPKFIW